MNTQAAAPMVRFNLDLPAAQYAWLRATAAARRDGSMAAVIREALERAMLEAQHDDSV